MGTISSSTGLVTGLPIQEIVSKLISLDSGPMNQLQTRDTALQASQTAYTTLSAEILALEFTTNGTEEIDLGTRTFRRSGPNQAWTAQRTDAAVAWPSPYFRQFWGTGVAARVVGSYLSPRGISLECVPMSKSLVVA